MPDGFVHPMPHSTTMFANRLFGTGRIEDKSSIKRRWGAIEGTWCPNRLAMVRIGRTSYTPGCPHPSRGLILNGRKHSCGTGIQITRSFPTSDPASTSRGLACVPFWNDVCAELSQKSWYPIGTDSLELDSALWSSYSSDQDAFSKSLKIQRVKERASSQKTSWRCSPTSPPSTTGDGRIVVRKVCIHPSPSQRALFKYLFGAHRWFFNKTKSVCDKSSQEAFEARIAELSTMDTGICQANGCASEVHDVAGEMSSKKRWFCTEHVKTETFGAKARICGVSAPYEALASAFDHNCLTRGCQADASPGSFRCEEHADDGVEEKDPKRPIPASPFNFMAVKTLIVKDADDLLANETWHRAVPCNSKTGSVKQYISAAKSTFTKWQNGDDKAKLPGWKSKKDYNQEFIVRDNAISFRKAKAKGKMKRKKVRGRKMSSRRRPKSRFRDPRPRGSRGREWELKIFSGQNFAAMSTGDTNVTSAATRPIRLKRCDMVRLKRAATMGVEGSTSDWCEAKVIRDRGGHHHLYLPIKVTEREAAPIWTSQGYQDAFLDPGGRTFMTMYSPDGVAAAIGDDFYANKLPTLRKADGVMGAAERRRTQLGGEDRNYRRMLLRAHVLRTKVRNCVRDLHRKTARFLCANFKAVFIPKFETGRIGSTTQLARRILSGAVRGLMTFAHGEFLQTLLKYARARSVHVIQVGESHTTLTCTFCGQRNDVGSKKRFRCCGCRRTVHRDPAASRNIGFRTAVFPE